VCLESARIPGGTCSFFAARAGLFGTMSSPRAGRGACPVVGAAAVGDAHFRRRDWVSWDYVQLSCGHGTGQRRYRAGLGRLAEVMFTPCKFRGACPLVGLAGWGMLIHRRPAGAEPDTWAVPGDHVQPWSGLWRMSHGGGGQRRACPFFADRTGLFGTMSSLCTQQGACPPAKPQDGAGRAQLGEAGKFRYSSICF
jgi:hypothetical protein